MEIALSMARSSLSCPLATCAEGTSGYTIKRRNVVTKQLLRAMKLTGIVILATCLHLSASGVGQGVTLSLKDAPLEKIFIEIIRQSGKSIIYNDASLKNTKPVTIEVKNATPQEVLDLSLKGQPFYYSQEDGYLIVKSAPVPGLQPQAFKPEGTPPIRISGTIIGSNKQPLIGATIRLKGKNISTTSDEQGRFQLEVETGSILQVSYVGFKLREFKVSSQDEVVIDMQQADNKLDTAEIILSTGYQQIPKERATGSFAFVDNKTFNRRVSNNILDRLDDVVPGLLFDNKGFANPLKSYEIRGASTINAETNPLIVVDNYIYDGDIRQLNPNDVENITVLKDAAASSIWGVRAGNGVIVITMKKGKKLQKTAMNFNVNTTFSRKPKYRSLPSVSSKDIIELEKTKFNAGYYDPYLQDQTSFPVVSQVAEILNKQKNGELTEPEATLLLQKLSEVDTRAEIEKYLLQVPVSQQYAFDISGGTDKYRYYASIGFNNDRGYNINKKESRLTIRSTNTWNPIKNIYFTGEFNLITKSQKNANNLVEQNLLNAPYNKLADENGNPAILPYKYNINYVDTVSAPGLLDWHYRPLDEARNGNMVNKIVEYLLIGKVSYVFLNDFKFEAQYQYNRSMADFNLINSLALFETRDLINRFVTTDPVSGQTIYPYPVGDTYFRRSTLLTSWSVKGQLDYNKRINLHSINGLIGIETRETNTEEYGPPLQYGYNPSTNTFQSTKIGSWQTRPANWQSEIAPLNSGLGGQIKRYGGYFLNGSYNYDRRYTLSFSGRIDQSNFFGVEANDRIVPLWSAGIAWDISNESFYHSSWINSLKLRTTYGYSGNVNAGVSPFATAQYYSGATSTNMPYANIVNPPNPSLKWERLRISNIGLDFGMFKNRVNGSIEFFKKNGLDLINTIIASPSSGFLQYNGNNASLITKGMDARLSVRNQWNDLSLNSTIIFSYNTNKVTSYAVLPPSNNWSPDSYSSIYFPIIGKPIDRLYTYRWAGLDPADGDGMIYIDNKAEKSLMSTNAVPERDYVYHGRPTPAYFGSFRNDFRWKNMEVSVGITYRFKYVFLRSSLTNSFNANASFMHEDYYQSWNKPGDEKYTNVPGLQGAVDDFRFSVYTSSDILVEKGDHIKLQDINISYDLSGINTLFNVISSASVYAYVNNIGILWKASKYNVETRNQLSVNTNLLSVSAGIKIGF